MSSQVPAFSTCSLADGTILEGSATFAWWNLLEVEPSW